MKTPRWMIPVLLALSFGRPAEALDKPELDQRIRTLTQRFEAMQLKPDRCIPADTLKRARGIVLLDRTKAGFLFAYQGGSGVALVRDPKTDQWGAASFVEANEASLGFQIGGEKAFFVLLLMNTNATRLLTEPNFSFGGEARGTAAENSAGSEGLVNPPGQSVLVFDERKGLYGGAAIKGGAISPDDRANIVYYDAPVSIADILFAGKVKPTESASALAEKIDGRKLARP
jgi:lipid-binding SYLF domain-containing protein